MYYEGTEIKINIGDRVCDYINDSTEGTLEQLTEGSFTILWDDGLEKTYDTMYIDCIRPI